MYRIDIIRIFTLVAFAFILTEPTMASEPDQNQDIQISLNIHQVGYFPNGSLFNPTLQLEVKASAPLPSNEEVMMLRVYRQNKKGSLDKQDIYLTGSANGINRALHTPSASWADQVTLSPLAGGTRHYYTFSLVTNRNEYFSNSVAGDIAVLPEKQMKSEDEIRILPVVFHIFDHPNLPQFHFDAETRQMNG